MAEVWTPPVFDDVATSELVTAAQLNAFGNSLRFLKRVGIATQVTDVTTTATTAGTATQIVSLGSITYDNVPHLFEFFCPRAEAPAANMTVLLRDSTTILGTWTRVATSGFMSPLYCAREFTPSAAAHTYNVAAYVGSGTGTFNAGSGGAAGDATTDFEIWMRATRVPT